MSTLKTTLLIGPTPSPATLQELKKSVGFHEGTRMVFMVYQIEFENELYYCCWSGGEMKDGHLYLTPSGQGALEALENLALGSNETLIVKHLVQGPTPLREKIVATLRMATPQAKICFFGDLHRDLDGAMEPAFNVQPGSIRV